MISLDDAIWKNLNGGYKILYDVSVPLKELEVTNDNSTIETIWKELWNELHHQGDVGLASYLAVPQLARIAKLRDFFNWNLLGICTTIEQQRHLGNNPQLPKEYENHYYEGLNILKQFVIANIDKQINELTFRTALSTLAVCSGQIKLSKAIIELEDDTLNEFLEQF
ncbi:MAG TPA: hypothetical protein VHZ50_07190 [Puia sp.]|nr:hypothetical protein [Puia sp.]